MFKLEGDTFKEKMQDLGDWIWFYISETTKNWIYPAYKLKNFLINKRNIVKIPQFSPFEWYEPCDRMYYANMELVKEFIESEPEKYVEFYGKYGRKYGDNKEYYDRPLIFPEYEGMYMMDLVKKIYIWYTKEEQILDNEYWYMLHLWSEYFRGEWIFEDDEKTGFRKHTGVDRSKCPKCLDDLKDIDIDWSIVDKYVDGDRNNLFKNEDYVFKKVNEIEKTIEVKRQEMLHLCTEVRMILCI